MGRKKGIIDGTIRRRWLGQILGILTLSLGAWLLILYLREWLLSVLKNPILLAVLGLGLITIGVIIMTKAKMPRTWS